MRHRSRSRRATPCASFDGSGYAKGNFEALSTTSSKYSFSRLRRVRKFLIRLPLAPPMVREIWQVALPTAGYATASYAYTHTIERTPARLYTCLASGIGPAITLTFSRPRDARVGQCIRSSRSDTGQLGMAITDVRLTNVALGSPVRYLLTTSFVKPFVPAIFPWPNNACVTLFKKGSAPCIQTKRGTSCSDRMARSIPVVSVGSAERVDSSPLATGTSSTRSVDGPSPTPG